VQSDKSRVVYCKMSVRRLSDSFTISEAISKLTLGTKIDPSTFIHRSSSTTTIVKSLSAVSK
jgi:hypothetical protein